MSVLDVTTAVHFYEAILATFSILIWHFYFVIFDPDVYPLKWTVLTGRAPEHEVREEEQRPRLLLPAAAKPPGGGTGPAPSSPQSSGSDPGAKIPPTPAPGGKGVNGSLRARGAAKQNSCPLPGEQAGRTHFQHDRELAQSAVLRFGIIGTSVRTALNRTA